MGRERAPPKPRAVREGTARAEDPASASTVALGARRRPGVVGPTESGDVDRDPRDFRCGHVAVIGRPNVGKSTLVNRLVGAHVSITSRKPQTTRHRIAGILTTDEAQLVFVDTPGFQSRHRTALNRRMNRAISEGLASVDVVTLVVEAGRFDDRDRDALALVPSSVPVVVAVNKIDLMRDRRALLPFLEALAREREFAALVPLSAERGTQVDRLVAAIVPLLPEAPPRFDPDQLTDRDERFLAAELVREKIFRQLGDEVPYATAVVIDAFEQEGDLRRIHATVYVERAGQRAILLGERGERMKRIASDARADMQALFGGTVWLEVWVKVKPGWADDERSLARMRID